MTALNPVRTIESQMIDIQQHEEGSRSEKRGRAIDMLHRVGIPDPQSRIGGYPHHFSGGYDVPGSRRIIADEPTAGLDVSV
ncbi:hypothetical protein [Rhizobium mongolense]|uniref:hypothetical protein n=1 Tax=Rhizobium mongolense TaxID=57676 RepID=UPI0034A1567E